MKKISTQILYVSKWIFFLEVPPGFEPGDKGFADPRLTTWLWHRKKMER